MTDYNRRHYDRRDNSDNYYRRGRTGDYGVQAHDRYGNPYDENINRGYSSFGSGDENPYRDVRHRGDYGTGNFSGSNDDRDFEFGMNRRGGQHRYGSYNSRDYDDIDRRHDWHPSDSRHGWQNNPNNLGAGSNYAYNRGGYGSNYGGEYGRFPERDMGSGYANEFGNASYAHRRRGTAYEPDRNYSSYSGKFDQEYERNWERDNRDWWDRTRDEVASWFGDDEAEHRRRQDKYKGAYYGKGPKGYRRSDSRIEEDINDRLADDGWVDASDITVKVENGEVTLTGTTPDRFSKRRAEDVTESVSGVRNVENRVKVSYTQQAPAHTAGQVARADEDIVSAQRMAASHDPDSKTMKR